MLLSRGDNATRPHPPTGGPPGACPAGTHPALPRPSAPPRSTPPAAQARAPALCPTPDARARRETQRGLDPGYKPRTCDPAPIQTLMQARAGVTPNASTPGTASDHTGESGDMVCRRRSPTPSLDRRMASCNSRRAGRDAADAHRRGDRHGHTGAQRREVAPAFPAPRIENPSGARVQAGAGRVHECPSVATGGGPKQGPAPRTLMGLRARGTTASSYLWG